jgi:hypothetical protein
MTGDEVDDFALAPNAPVRVDHAGEKDDPPLTLVKRRPDTSFTAFSSWRTIYDSVVRRLMSDERRVTS